MRKLRQTACLVINPIMVGNCFPLEWHAGRSDIKFYDCQTYDLSIDERVKD